LRAEDGLMLVTNGDQLVEGRRRGDQLADPAGAELLRLTDLEIVDLGASLDVRALARGHGGLLDRLPRLRPGRGALEAELDPLIGGLEVQPPGGDRAGAEVDREHQADRGGDLAPPLGAP